MVWIPKNEGFRIFLGKETETQESENCLFVWLCLAAEKHIGTCLLNICMYIYILYLNIYCTLDLL